MAFVQKKGSRYVVRQGNNGRRLSSFGSKTAADKEVKRLHKKNMPKASNRGASARKRNRQRR